LFVEKWVAGLFQRDSIRLCGLRRIRSDLIDNVALAVQFITFNNANNDVILGVTPFIGGAVFGMEFMPSPALDSRDNSPLHELGDPNPVLVRPRSAKAAIGSLCRS
jgi:hypothetical protein